MSFPQALKRLVSEPFNLPRGRAEVELPTVMPPSSPALVECPASPRDGPSSNQTQVDSSGPNSHSLGVPLASTSVPNLKLSNQPGVGIPRPPKSLPHIASGIAVSTPEVSTASFGNVQASPSPPARSEPAHVPHLYHQASHGSLSSNPGIVTPYHANLAVPYIGANGLLSPDFALGDRTSGGASSRHTSNSPYHGHGQGHGHIHDHSHTHAHMDTPNGPDDLPNRPKSPAISMASHAPPETFADLAMLYNVVAERRAAFDNLMWQVPATCLTGHAFLFSISLAPDTSRFARVASMSLCILITVLTLHLFTRQLQAEDADNHWLTDFEERHGVPYMDRAHGARWREYRNRKPPGAGRLGWLALHRSYPLWSKGMISIGALALAIIIITLVDDRAVMGFNCQPF